MGTVMNQIDMQQAVSQAYTLAIKMYCAFTDGGWMDLEDIVSTKEIPGMESYTIDFSEYLLNDVSESTYEMRLRALEHSVEYTTAISRRGLRLNQGYTADATEKQFKLFQKSFYQTTILQRAQMYLEQEQKIQHKVLNTTKAHKM